MKADNYVIDGLAPKKVFEPESTDDLRDLIKESYQREESLSPWGFGSRQHIGNKITNYSSAVSLKKLTNIISFEPKDLTLTVEAGANIYDINSLLSEYKLSTWYIPYSGLNTIGGYIASNCFDPYRSQFGSIRENLIGLTFIDGTGTKIKSGGKVVKNVQGIDIHKMHVGAFGTLGVISEISLKLAPFEENKDSEVKNVIFSGPPSNYANFNINESKGLQLKKHVVQIKANFTRDNLNKFMESKLINDNNLISCGAVINHGTALLEFSTDNNLDCKSIIDELIIEISNHDAYPILEKIPIELKDYYDVFGKKPDSFFIMQRLKNKFDPKKILNPGRFLGNL